MSRLQSHTIVISDSEDDADVQLVQALPVRKPAQKPVVLSESDKLNAIVSEKEYIETVLYSMQNEKVSCEFPLTSKSIFANAIFSQDLISGSQDDNSFGDLLRKFKDMTNYDVVEIGTVHNKKRQLVFDAMLKAYNIDNTVTVYHGTSLHVAKMIMKVGFKGASSRRSLWGSGCYAGKRFLESAGYARPHSFDDTQIILVCKLLVGAQAVGRMNQEDFGEDVSGNPIMTLTNHNKTILCASQEAQLIVESYIKIRWCSSIGWKDCFEYNNCWLHLDVSRKHRHRIVASNSGDHQPLHQYGKVPVPQVAQTSSSDTKSSADLSVQTKKVMQFNFKRRKINVFRGIRVGKPIFVSKDYGFAHKRNLNELLNICDTKEGVVVDIRKDANDSRHFWVRMNDKDTEDKGEKLMQTVLYYYEYYFFDV